jgi:hypothetical protein
MSRRFIVGIADATPAQNEALRKYFKENGSWWGWILNFWLVTTNEVTKAKVIRDKLMEKVRPSDIIVIDQDDPIWAGYGTKTAERDMFRWIKGTWDAAES